jgi:hypothetical protein
MLLLVVSRLILVPFGWRVHKDAGEQQGVYISLLTEGEQKIMPNALAELPCSEPGPPESQAIPQSVADLSQRVAAWKPAWPGNDQSVMAGFVPRMTRLDRCPYGWKPHPKDLGQIIADSNEQETIRLMFGAVRSWGMGAREICRYLDSRGCKRRGGKRWAGAQSLVRAILARPKRENGLY